MCYNTIQIKIINSIYCNIYFEIIIIKSINQNSIQYYNIYIGINKKKKNNFNHCVNIIRANCK